jgi:wobble nucleotide-excising tRNase
MRKIPGFEGYKNREQARTADQIQRKFMSQKLTEQKAKLTDVGREMIRSGNVDQIEEVDRISKILDKVNEKIEHAVHGYSGLFDAVRIGEMELDTLYEYDLGMVDNISAIGEGIDAVMASVESEGGDPKARLRDLEKTAKALDQKLTDRKKVVMGVE